MGISLKTYVVKLKVTVKNDSGDLLDKIANRVYNLDEVEDVTIKLKRIDEQQTQQTTTSILSQS
jgi:hypothetical protein